jgi:hypothetical protein
MLMMKSTFMFLTNLAYKNRITIPLFVTIAFLVCNFRWEIEISIQTERIQLQANNSDNDDHEELTDIDDSDDDEYEPVSDDDDISDSSSNLL